MSVKLNTYILFRSRGKKFELFGNLLVNESILESVESTSFLGINIDEHLTWKKHITCVCSVLSKRIGILYRLRHFVYRKILIMLYNTFILPHITYGLEVFGAALKTFMNPIIIIQLDGYSTTRGRNICLRRVHDLGHPDRQRGR